MDWSLVFGNAAAELISPTTAAYALAAIGLAVHFGYTGLLNFGQAAFMAIGAYGFAVSVLNFGLSFWQAIAVAMILSIVFALILGIPTLRLRSDYLAIVTIAAAEILRYVVSTTSLKDLTGGSGGLSGFSQEFYSINPFAEGNYLFWPFDVTEKELWVRVFGWSLVALATILVLLMMRSPWGRVVKSIREDEDAVRSLGKNVYAYKMQSLIFGGALGTLAGIVFVLPRSVQPGNYVTGLTFFIWTIMLLGGAATIFGPIVGSMIFWVLLSLTEGVLQGLVNMGVITFLTTDQIGPVRFILIGLGLMALVVFRPQGIFGNKKELQFNV
jgi:branched-chain amino acid transport system permease protein